MEQPDFLRASGEEQLRLMRVCASVLRKVGWSELVTMLREGRASRAELLAAFASVQ